MATGPLPLPEPSEIVAASMTDAGEPPAMRKRQVNLRQFGRALTAAASDQPL